MRSIGTVQDSTRRAEAEQELQRAAFTDALTQLPNRQGALRHLSEVCANPGLVAAPGFGAFNLDVDQFQAINDSFGAEVGDRLLVSIAATLRAVLPDTAVLARLESDEFLVLLPCAAADLQSQAEAIQRHLASVPHPDPILPLLPTVSIGMSHYPSNGRDATLLLQAANTALMEAKRSGKAGICRYSDAISERIRERVSMEAELQEAIEAEAFHLVFQPQLNRSGALVGAEVLLRWCDRQGRLVSPALFIPLAEQSGLIHRISDWVVDRPCRQLRSWRDQGLTVPRRAGNLSAAQCGRAGGALARKLLAILECHGLEAQAFELEVTETALLQDLERCREESLILSEVGFRLAIDDFGTGYASMVSLRSLPVTTIKIDSSFVQRMGDNSVDDAIVKGMIRLAHDLQMVALAEGVETEQQHQRLLELGCDCFQGYLFDRPLSPEAFSQRLPRSTR